MKIATSPFVYWGVAVFMPEKLGNLQVCEKNGGELPVFSRTKRKRILHLLLDFTV